MVKEKKIRDERMGYNSAHNWSVLNNYPISSIVISVQIFYFFLSSFWYFVYFSEFLYYLGYQIWSYNYSYYFLINFFISAASSFQSCPTLCDPIDGSPPGSPIPGILQARTLEWVAIAFSETESYDC